MKKRWIVLSILMFLSALPLSSSQDIDPSDPSQVLGSELGVNPDNIPTNTDDLKREYLQKEWTTIIENSTYLGPVHKFLEESSPVLRIVLGRKYELSFTFLFVIILWVLMVVAAYKLLSAWGIVKKGIAFLISLVLAIILANAKIIPSLASLIYNIVIKPENWWMRIIMGIIVFGVILVGYVFSSMFAKRMEKSRKENVQTETEKELKNVKAFAQEVRQS